MSEALPNDFINSLLEKAATKRATSKKLDLRSSGSRDIMIWVKLDHTFTLCANPTCPDDRPLRTQEGKAMCTLVGSEYVCRLCFLAGYALDNPAGMV